MLCALATWRLTHFFVAEDGPWDCVVRLRAWLGDRTAGRILDCFYCASLLLAVPFAFFIANNLWNWLLVWLAIAGAAGLLEQVSNRNTAEPTSASHRERDD